MKRRWNKWLWAGFGLVLLGLLTYIPIFARFPLTRDFPWLNLLMCAVGLALLAMGMGRAFRQPERYRGKVFGSVFALLSLLGVGFFCWGILYEARKLPASGAAPHVGQKAPDFTLPDQDGKPVALAELLASASTSSAKPGGLLLIFYRGYW
jgi:hypothetical protein